MSDPPHMTLPLTSAGPAPGAARSPESGVHAVACSVEMVRSEDAFDALAQEWSALAEDAPVSIFQTYEWLRTWWTYFGNRRSLWIHLFRYDGRLVGIAPLFVDRERILGVPLARHAQFLGCGLSDYTDMIILPGYEQSVLESFARHLTTTTEDWDVLDLEDINEQSAAARFLPAILRNQQIDVYQYRGNVCPYVALPEKAENLVTELSPTARYNFRRKFRSLQSQFKAEIEFFRSESDDLTRAVTEFSFIHGERWKSLGFPSAFDNERHRAFHVEIATKFARRDWLRMFFLNVDGMPVAVTFCFNYHKRIYMYQSNAHASDAVMRCSPGFLVRSVAMVEGIAEGMRVFDFLRGDEAYKYREWDAVDSQNWLFRARSPLPAGKLRFTLFLGKELLAKMRNRLTREYYEFKRMRIVKNPTPAMLTNYVLTKVFHLLRMGVQFILRHSPLGAPAASAQRRGAGPNSYEALHDFDSSAILAYTLGEKLTRLLRGAKINNLLWRLRSIMHPPGLLEEGLSTYSGPYKVVQRGPERQLVLGKSTWSIAFGSGRWPEARREYWGAMCESPYGIRPGARVLLLGLGGGTIPHLLHRAHTPASMTVIENDPVIIDVAKRHFSVGAIPGLTIIERDATAGIRALHGEGARFDLILDDVFNKVTGKLSRGHQSVIKELTSMLNSGGSITFQRMIDTPGEEVDADRFVRSLRDMGYETRVRKIRHRWTNDVIYCRPVGS